MGGFRNVIPLADSQASPIEQQQWQDILDNSINKQQFAEVTINGANFEHAIEHGLGRLPLGFIVMYQDLPAITYKSDLTEWDNNFIYLKCNTDSVNLKILIF